MTITLSGQPQSTNHIYKSACIAGRASVYMSAAGKALKEAYQWEAKSQWDGEPLSGPVEVAITLFHGDKRARDLDNYGKVLLDALTGIVWLDDKQIMRMTVVKAYDKTRPRVEVEIIPAASLAA